VTDEVIRDLYKVSSFLLFPSREEGFGLPLIEAASWRLPAVISPIASLVCIAEDTGTLVVDSDHEAGEQIARRIIAYMAANPAYQMQRRVFSLYTMPHQFESLGWRLPVTESLPWRVGAQTTHLFPRRRIEDQFLDALHNGLDAFEVFFDPHPEHHLGFNPEDLKEDIRGWLREQAAAQDVCLSVYARRHIPDRTERSRHWGECLAFAQAVGAAILVIDLPPPAAFPAGDFDLFVRDLREVIDAASGSPIQVAIENGSWEAGGCFLTSAEHLNDLFVRVGRGGNTVGVSFNAGRAHRLADPVVYLHKVHVPVFHVKLSDNQGPGHEEVHQRLGEGTLPLGAVLAVLQRRGYHGMIILEYFYADLRRDRERIEAALSLVPCPCLSRIEGGLSR
jgi:sugar phosphate isomerase/epimerase